MTRPGPVTKFVNGGLLSIFEKRYIPLKKQLIFPLLLLAGWTARCQQVYWQQEVNYSIDVSLNDQEHTLTGFEKIDYTNHSPDTLTFIWFHLWPNAYKNDQTAYSNQSLENGNTKFYFSEKENRGYINRLDFKVNNIPAATEDHPLHIDIIKLRLPSPLLPGNTITITTPFFVKLSYNYSRSGHEGESYQVTQWYPKPAVYDRQGWHPMPYLDQGEFYSEFGSFDVRITLPENYVVAATGVLQNQEEKQWLKSRSVFSWEPQKIKTKSKSGIIQTVTMEFPPSSTKQKTLHFKQDRVHDFAWFADKRFVVNQDTCRLASGKIIDVYSYYTPSQKKFWKNSIAWMKDAVKTRSEWIGEYPYQIVSAVQGPESFGGGMEYPTITVISPALNERLLEFTLEHEIGHNWFYGILGTNERDYPWMDEGLNTYYDNRYAQWKYGDEGEIKFGKTSISVKNIERILFETKATAKKDQPIQTPAAEFTAMNYNLVAYYKTGAWMEMLEKKLGRGLLDKAMQEYYRQWQFRHPAPEDFKIILEKTSGQHLDQEFALLNNKGLLPGMERTGWKTVTPFVPASFISYINQPSKDWLLFSPVIGANSYDRLMIGALLTNYKLPPSSFRFLFTPLYSTGAKKINGLGQLQYSFYPEKKVNKIDLFLNGAVFSSTEFVNPDGRNHIAGFQKLTPGFRLTLKEKNPRTTTTSFIQWKSFFIKEASFRFRYDTIINGMDTVVSQNTTAVHHNRVLHQLKFVTENNRALYPYSAELNLDQGNDFLRATFTGHYFFNYPKGGGLDLRLFAGKFFYRGTPSLSKQFATERYHLNMTGPNGFEDYTYSNYFIGRNKYNGFASQQIMIRDGGFKVRTDLYSEKVGKTDDWLTAVNFTTSVPSGINPLSVLPVKIPLKLFADIGTYADAWKRDAGADRFIFDAGIQLHLLSDIIKIYIPVLYSPVYKEYYRTVLEKKNRFLKTISFSIDINQFSLVKRSRDMDL